MWLEKPAVAQRTEATDPEGRLEKPPWTREPGLTHLTYTVPLLLALHQRITLCLPPSSTLLCGTCRYWGPTAIAMEVQPSQRTVRLSTIVHQLVEKTYEELSRLVDLYGCRFTPNLRTLEFRVSPSIPGRDLLP